MTFPRIVHAKTIIIWVYSKLQGPLWSSFGPSNLMNSSISSLLIIKCRKIDLWFIVIITEKFYWKKNRRERKFSSPWNRPTKVPDCGWASLIHGIPLTWIRKLHTLRFLIKVWDFIQELSLSLWVWNLICSLEEWLGYDFICGSEIRFVSFKYGRIGLSYLKRDVNECGRKF